MNLYWFEIFYYVVRKHNLIFIYDCYICRLIEVNGKIVLNKNRDDLMRLLSAAPDPAQIVVLRKLPQNGEIVLANNHTKELVALRSELEETKEKADEVQRIKESLKSDNIRLTHRISYLEEQVLLIVKDYEILMKYLN